MHYLYNPACFVYLALNLVVKFPILNIKHDYLFLTNNWKFELHI